MANNIQVQNVQRMRFYAEPNSSTYFGVDHSATLTDYTDIPFIEGSADLKLEYETQSPGYARQERDEHPEEILIRKRATLTFSVPLLTPDTKGGNGVTVAATPVGSLLACVLGGSSLGTGDTVNGATATTSVIPVTTASRWKAGGAFGWLDSNSVLHCREIESVDSVSTPNTITAKLALPAAPAAADVLYNCATYYMDNHDADNTTSAQFVIEGLGTSDGGFNDAWVLLGGQATTPIKYELVNGQIPKITFTFTFASFLNGDDAAMSPGALTPAGYQWAASGNVVVATTANITLAGAQTIDAVSVVAGNRVLVKDQTLSEENGVYVAASPGAWARATDWDSTAEVENAAVRATGGTTSADHWYTQTVNTVTIGVTHQHFADMGATLAEMEYTNANTFAVVDSEFRVGVAGVATLAGTEFNPSEYTIEPQFKYQEVTSPGGVNNIACYVVTGDHPKVQGKFSLPYEDKTFYNARNNHTNHALFLQIGSSSTLGAILLTVPTFQVTDWQRKDVGGIQGQEVTWKGRRDLSPSEPTPTVKARSPHRIHVF